MSHQSQLQSIKTTFMTKYKSRTTFAALCLFCISITACQSEDAADQNSSDQSSDSNQNSETKSPRGKDKSTNTGTRENKAGQKSARQESEGTNTTATKIVLGPDSVKQFEGEGNMRFLDQAAWYEINKLKREVEDKGEKYTSEDYLTLALCHLMIGRFDTTVELLDECKEKAPPGRKLLIGYNGTMEAAKDVKRALTAARDQLRKKHKDITYPDERIFVQAIKSVPRDDHRLIINLSDAWATAFPESRFALLNDAEQNLGFFESWPDKTNVLAWRTIQTIHRGEGALRRAYQLDRSDPYPIIRLMQFTLATILPKEGSPRSRRWEFFPEMDAFLSKMDSNENLTDSQKAFLKYGQAMFFLFNDEGWQRPHVDIGIDYLNDAIKLDPSQELYKSALKTVQENAREIERVKMKRGMVQRAQSMVAVELMFSPRFKPAIQRRNAVYDAMQLAVKVMHESIKKEHGEKGEKAVELLESVGCPGCWGSGKDIAGGTCPMCQGTGNWYDLNKPRK